MVSRTEAILNLFETKAKREVWLDRFAASNLSIDNFCELNHIKKETITKAINEKMSSYREQNPPKQPAVKISDFVEVEAATEPDIKKAAKGATVTNGLAINRSSVDGAKVQAWV